MENHHLKRLEKGLDPLLKKALNTDVFSAVAVGIYQYRQGQELRLILTRGKTRSDEQGMVVNNDTFFDLASLTKPFCTTLGILCLIQKKEIDWETKIFDILSYAVHPELRNISVDQLLTHSAGLLAYKPVFQSLLPSSSTENKEYIINEFTRESPAYQPGSACLYSDPGYILLGALIEKIAGTGLDTFYRSEITLPLDVQEIMQFRPLPLQKKEENNIAATELCPWRQKLLQGEAHDEHAWLMNGVAGHAGLFGTINGVMAVTEHLLHLRQGRTTHPGFSDVLLRKAMTKKYADRSWCRGFDTPAAQGSSAGTYFSPLSVGHLGYTGTSFWIDPDQDVVVVLLSNRVYPTRKNERIKQFRPLLHNVVMEVLRG
ncbi:MAG: serine hydrolase domain-containing protein [Desulfobulbaceae bacterium]